MDPRQVELSLLPNLSRSVDSLLTMVQTFSLTIGGVAQHLISYYKVEDVEQGRLRSPSSLPELASLDISPEYLDKTHFRNPPKVEIGVDGIPRYRGEADDIETSPVLSSPLAINYPDNEGPSSKRPKAPRYDPYNPSPTTAKRPRKAKAGSTHNGDTDTEPTSPTYSSPVHQPAPGYPEGSLSATTNQYTAPYPYYPPTYPPTYSPAPYPVPVSPVQPPQQSPTPPHAPPTAQIPYPAYPSESHQQTQSSPVYPYYPQQPAGYSNYNMWPPYAGYGAQPQQHGSPGASGAQDRPPREPEEGDDGT